jgi:transposase
MSSLPEWAARYKKNGIAIEQRNGRYYASRVHSIWNSKKGRAQKITDEYLGVVTPEGIVPPKHKRRRKVGGVLEAGNFAYLDRFTSKLAKPLREFWPESWQSILAAGALKLGYQDPLKRLAFRYKTSLACRLWPEVHLSKNSLTQLLDRLGREWSAQRSFFEQLSKADSYMAIDLTQVFSDSRNISWLEKGYNSQGLYHDQLKILLLWGVETHLPGFLKILPGTASAAQNLMSAIWESRLKNVLVVGDKAFFSEDNVKDLEDYQTHYVLSLKRDFSFLQYPVASRYKKYFFYRKSAQWWREYEWYGRRVVQYLDKQLAAEEETSFLRRMDEGKASKGEYQGNKKRFGTLALLTDTGLSPQCLYRLYKQRREIELSFDALKNTLEGDKTWMQSRESLQGYYFILFIALHVYSQVLDHLRQKDLLKKYSVHDVLWQLSKVYMVDIGGQDIVSEVTKSARKLIAEIEVPITEKLGS